MITLEMLLAVLPQLILAFGLVLSLLLIAWQRSQFMIQLLAKATLVFAIIASIQNVPSSAIMVTPLLKVDGYSTFAFVLIAISALVVSKVSLQFLKNHIEVHDEYYVLLLLVVFGASILVVSNHFASLFLGFEVLSIALVGLVGYLREDKYAVETGFKYLILSATASSFMLLGVAFIYSQTGDMSFSTLHTTTNDIDNFYAAGILLFIVGVAFKLSLAPFHFWTPDVYQGSPTPVTLLMATVSKVAMITVLMKCWFNLGLFEHANVVSLLSGIAILSMIAGNALALKQTNIKRLLGYSSIAHMGYLLIVMMVSTKTSIALAWQSSLFYLTAYVLANLSIFVAIIYFSQLNKGSHENEEVTIAHWQGLFWQNKLLSSLIIVAILSLAGIPLTMGFIGKFYILNQATQLQLWWLIGALIIGSGISLYYYLRIIFALFTTDSEPTETLALRFNSRILLIVLIGAGIIFGVYPDTVAQLISSL